MVIIRRNADGSIANPEVANTTQSHPALATKRGMQALQDAGRSVPPLMSEIATKINNAKDKPRKLKVLQDNDSVPLRQVLKGAFDPNIEWLLPKGTDVPYTVNDAPIGTEHTLLSQEAKRLYLFTKGGDNTLTQNKRETLFIQMLEGLHESEAKLLVAAKDKRLHQVYKGLSQQVVKEAFDWTDDYKRDDQNVYHANSRSASGVAG